MARPHLALTAWQQLAHTTIPPKLYNPVALNINMTHTPYNMATAALRLQPVYSYGCSTVAVNLRLRPIYGYGQSTVTANPRFRPIHGSGQSTVVANLQLQPLYFVTMASLPITATVLLYLDYMHYQSATLVQ